MRRALALVAMLALAGCVGPLVGQFADDPEQPSGSLADPDSDVQGWEDGYWYNESLDVDTADGLTEAELEAVVARATARVERIREVEFSGDVPVTTIDRSEFGGGGGGSTPHPDMRAFDNGKMEALLLAGEDEDSLAVQRQNRQVSVGGYYSVGRDEIVVVTEGEGAVVEELTLAHELVHTWQDQRFDLSTFGAKTRDGHNANNGLIEGDANLVEHVYEKRCATEWDCVAPPDDGGSGGGGQLANYGIFVMKFFPYSDGPAFVAQRRQAGGWEAVNELYRDPPASAEQVIHPEKYGSDPPTDVTLRDRTTGEWERVRPPDRVDYATVGQSGIMAMFVYPMYHSEGNTSVVPPDAWFNRTEDGVSRFDPFNYDHRYAAGWDGDRMHVYESDDGESGYVWRIVWDSPADAREFYDGYRQVLRYWGAEEVDEGTFRIDDGPFEDAFRVRVRGDTVTIANAPTVDQLGRVRTSMTEGGATPVESTPTPGPFEEVTPGLGPLAALLALLLAIALLRRR